MTTCTVAECDKPHLARGRCGTHYAQLRRAGAVPPRRQRGNCVINECTNLDNGPHGLCLKHYQRWRRTGTPERCHPMPSGADNPGWRGDNVKNPAVHRRIIRQLGPAKLHQCADCGDQAKHWSYNHTDPNEQSDENGPYGFTAEHYSPRCVPCHKKFDLGHQN